MSDEPEIIEAEIEEVETSSAPELMDRHLRILEALLFASAEPLAASELAPHLGEGIDAESLLVALQSQYAPRGVNLVRRGDKWAFRTAADLSFLLLRETTDNKPLSRAALETLSIIAYHQPVTRTEIEEIRGVAVSRGTLDQLIETGWVRLGRRRQTPGRPVTFVVTEAFLDHFGLASAQDLPALAELRAAGLLDSRPAGLDLAGKQEATDIAPDEPGDDLFGD